MNVKSEKINGMVYRLTIGNGANNVNAVLITGKKDSILIDTAYENRADEFMDVIESIASVPIRCIINTHHHFDHIGANSRYTCQIISHEKAKDRIAGKFFSFPPHLTEGVPSSTISDSVTIPIDDEVLEIRALPPAHTDGDLIIYLRESGILIMGDLLFSQTLPFIDLNNGGNVEGEMHVYRDIPALYRDCRLLIAGHGPNMTLEEFRAYGQTVEESVRFIKESYKSGMDRKAIEASSEYESLKKKIEDGGKFSEMWVDIVVDSLESKDPIARAMTKVLWEEGVEEAVDFYRNNHGNSLYKSEERDINLLAYNLMFRGRNEEALRFFELYAEVWPDSANAWDSLGEFHLNEGDKAKGRRYYEKALEMDPERGYIKEILDSIGS